jgi:hypothetical protein
VCSTFTRFPYAWPYPLYRAMPWICKVRRARTPQLARAPGVPWSRRGKPQQARRGAVRCGA